MISLLLINAADALITVQGPDFPPISMFFRTKDGII
jgi:hypothetical protein